MKRKTIIMMGNSGCGKGTQASILEKNFKEKNEKVFHLELGNEFRNLMNSTSYTAEMVRKLSSKGILPPQFLAIKLWGELFDKYYSSEKHLIIDGTPRRINEAYILEEALKFYEIEKPVIIFLNISRESAEKRMTSRGRSDDTDKKIQGRLDWFEKDVLPVIEYFKSKKDFEVIEIDGEKSIEDISADIKEKLKL